VLLQARVGASERHFPKPAPLFSQGTRGPVTLPTALRLLCRSVLPRTTGSRGVKVPGAAACGQSPKLKLSQRAPALDQ
jgi:hypothetical protein